MQSAVPLEVSLEDYVAGRTLASVTIHIAARDGGEFHCYNFTLTPTAATGCADIMPGSDTAIECGMNVTTVGHRVIFDCHFAVQLNHFIPGFPSYSVAVFLKCQSDLSLGRAHLRPLRRAVQTRAVGAGSGPGQLCAAAAR
jgi:hypothetical protein